MFAPDPRFERLDSLEGASFELALVELFELLGFDEVTHIGGYDKGADIVVRREGERLAVQAKRQASPVAIGAVRQLIDGIRRYECDKGLLVTNSYFTPPAIECAEEWGIELWDRQKISEFLDGEVPQVNTSVCAACAKPVSSGTTKWCLDQPWRYGGNVFCRAHQSRKSR
ncbi:MAG TPA: restriction endonuclease [Microbacteriaceae bacterium]|jgi:restriction system protein|nr:restriction endonuclease [Microbacteriaceae bacterium]